LNAPNNGSDPFGGQDGLNQAILEQNGPVKIFATGFGFMYGITGLTRVGADLLTTIAQITSTMVVINIKTAYI